MKSPNSHPQGCHDDNCQLSYRDHLLSVGISADALPTVKAETSQANVREKRWIRDDAAYLRLRKQGYRPPSTNGAYALEQYARGPSDLNGQTMKMKVDYSDPSTNLPAIDLPKLPD